MKDESGMLDGTEPLAMAVAKARQWDVLTFGGRWVPAHAAPDPGSAVAVIARPPRTWAHFAEWFAGEVPHNTPQGCDAYAYAVRAFLTRLAQLDTEAAFAAIESAAQPEAAS